MTDNVKCEGSTGRYRVCWYCVWAVRVCWASGGWWYGGHATAYAAAHEAAKFSEPSVDTRAQQLPPKPAPKAEAATASSRRAASGSHSVSGTVFLNSDTVRCWLRSARAPSATRSTCSRALAMPGTSTSDLLEQPSSSVGGRLGVGLGVGAGGAWCVGRVQVGSGSSTGSGVGLVVFCA